MPMLALMRSGRGGSPLSLLATLLVLSGLFAMIQGRISTTRDVEQTSESCEESDAPLCASEGNGAARGGLTGAAGPVLSAESACLNVGYLCAELESTGTVQIRRWKDHEGTIVVHIPRPDFLPAGEARRLQVGAAAGVRQWSGQPFPISVDERGNREADFAVEWRRTMGGRQIGVARTQWSAEEGLEVIMLELATQSPFGGSGTLDPRQVRLTAAHEMGHALGILMHSNNERDVMYSSNTATSLSARDYRTMEALYALADGTRIIR
jgi:predicted Zn-dependent protease